MDTHHIVTHSVTDSEQMSSYVTHQLIKNRHQSQSPEGETLPLNII